MAIPLLRARIFTSLPRVFLLCSLEPLTAVITNVFWLKISFGGFQFIGTLLILCMILYLTVFQKKTRLA